MQILEEIRADREGRINLAKVFDEIPTRVLVIYDTSEQAIFLKDDIEGGWTANQRKVDAKNRIKLPQWIRNKLGDVYYLTTESKKDHCLVTINSPNY